MQIFSNADRAYLSWLVTNQDGYVANAHRNPATYSRLHRATCNMINGEPANGTHWTAHYIKVCGNRRDISKWATGAGADPQKCPRCNP